MYPPRRRSYKPGNPKVLKGTDLPSLADYIQSKECKNVFLMLGAGVSTSAGIPDFRSPETGLYSNLARLNLPHPEAVFEINFFRRNPVPFYTLAHELYPGKFRPTITHSFIRLLSEKALLHTCFTQNIDTLERRAGVPNEKIIEAHGSFATQRCVDCHKTYSDEKMKDHIERKEIARCEHCAGYVKPDIVFFGEGLPDEFINALPSLSEADLLIVMGTSLTVQPFAHLVDLVPPQCPRVLVNLDRVGDFGSRSDDVILLGKCDDVILQLSKELGWEDALMGLWEQTEATVVSAPNSQSETKAAATVDKVRDDRSEKIEESAALDAIEDKLAKLSVGENVSKAKATEVAEGSTTKSSGAIEMAEKVAQEVSASMGEPEKIEAVKNPSPDLESSTASIQSVEEGKS